MHFILHLRCACASLGWDYEERGPIFLWKKAPVSVQKPQIICIAVRNRVGSITDKRTPEVHAKARGQRWSMAVAGHTWRTAQATSARGSRDPHLGTGRAKDQGGWDFTAHQLRALVRRCPAAPDPSVVTGKTGHCCSTTGPASLITETAFVQKSKTFHNTYVLLRETGEPTKWIF